MTVRVTAFSPSEQEEQHWVQQWLGRVTYRAIIAHQQPEWGQVLQVLRDAWLEQKGDVQ